MRRQATSLDAEIDEDDIHAPGVPPVRIRWEGRARNHVHERAISSDTDQTALAVDVFDRRDTYVVIESVEEARAILSFVEMISFAEDWLGVAQMRSLSRIGSKLRATIYAGEREEDSNAERHTSDVADPA